MSFFLYKPIGQGQLGGGKSTFFTEHTDFTEGGWYTPEGKLIEKFQRNQGPPHPGTNPAVKFWASKPGGAYGENAIAKFTDRSGKEYSYTIPDAGLRYVGDSLDPNSLKFENKGPMGGGGGGGGAYAPGQYGDYGYYPAYIGDQYPSPSLVNWTNIPGAKFNFTDPIEYAKKHAADIKNLYEQNSQMARETALGDLETELQGLRSYVPAATALKQSALSADNIFNQLTRNSQVDATLPGVREQLEQQGQDASTYASGRLPDSIQDRALELGVRSDAADRGTMGGFGAASSATRKVSDLMSADKRFQIAQYGNNLLNQNINQKSSLLLAPTQYSDAGAQVRVMPSVSGSQLASQARGELNNLTQVSATTGLQSTTQQEQFKSNLDQQTQQFNATGDMNAQQYNASAENQFKLGKFDYEANYANSVAGAAQTNSNTQVGIDQQQKALDTMNQFAGMAQQAQQLQSIVQGLGALLGGGGLTSIINQITSMIDSLRGNNVDEQPNVGGNAPPSGGSGGSGGGSSDGGSGSTPSIPTPNFDTGTDNTPDAGGNVPPTYTPEIPQSPVDESNGFNIDAPTTDDFGYGSDYGAGTAAVLKSAGISSQPSTRFDKVVYNTAGQARYVNANLNASTDVKSGANSVQFLKSATAPLQAFGGTDGAKLDQLAQYASSTSTLSELDTAASSGDKSKFLNTLVAGAVAPVSNGQKSATSQAMASGAALFTNWKNMSPAQKSLGVAALGLQAYRGATGTNIARTPIISKTGSTPGLTVGQALNMLSSGVNVYELANNWNQMNTAQKVSGGVNTAIGVARTAQSLGILGQGGIGNLASNNPYVMGALGAASIYGAVSGSEEGKEGNAITAAAGRGGAAYFTAGLSALAEGQLRQRIPGFAKAEDKAISTIQKFDPVTQQINLGFKAARKLGGMFGGGNKEHKARDGVRDNFRQVGITDGNNKIQLSDGTLADLGLDSNAGRHGVTNPDKLTKHDKSKRSLSAYDTDYTNDLDYSSQMAGSALSTLINGGKNTAAGQLGSQLGNAALGKVGYGKEMTADNFGKVMENMRGIYSKAGIKSKEEGYALVNQYLADKKINQTDAVTMHQALNMMYDRNGYDTAQRLMSGRYKGIETIQDHPDLAQAEPIGRQPISPGKLPSEINLQPGRPTMNIGGQNLQAVPVARPVSKRFTKEDIIALNSKRYPKAQPAALQVY